jgi:hypothetical protein
LIKCSTKKLKRNAIVLGKTRLSVYLFTLSTAFMSCSIASNVQHLYTVRAMNLQMYVRLKGRLPGTAIVESDSGNALPGQVLWQRPVAVWQAVADRQNSLDPFANVRKSAFGMIFHRNNRAYVLRHRHQYVLICITYCMEALGSS